MGYRAGGARGAEGLGGGDGPGAVAGSARVIPADVTAPTQTGCGSAAGWLERAVPGPQPSHGRALPRRRGPRAENAAGAPRCVVDSQWAWTRCE
jgi:hypothetical protein